MKMAVTIFGSTGCLRVHRLRSSFKLATPYLGCCESGSGNLRREIRACSARRTTTSSIRDVLPIACCLLLWQTSGHQDGQSGGPGL